MNNSITLLRRLLDIHMTYKPINILNISTTIFTNPYTCTKKTLSETITEKRMYTSSINNKDVCETSFKHS